MSGINNGGAVTMPNTNNRTNTSNPASASSGTGNATQ